MNNEITRRTALLLGWSTMSLVGSEVLKPSVTVANAEPRVTLETDIPIKFDGWALDPNRIPVLPNLSEQEAIDAIYSQVLARTYMHDDGNSVMLSIAYGPNQATDATAAHRPEFCYTAQGFDVTTHPSRAIAIGQTNIKVNVLTARKGNRLEQINYWMTLNRTAVLPGLSRKLEQIRAGLSGLIIDGSIIRISTLNTSSLPSKTIHDRFIAALYRNIENIKKPKYFGAT